MLVKTVQKCSDVFKIEYDECDGSIVVFKNDEPLTDLGLFLLSQFQLKLNKRNSKNNFSYIMTNVIYSHVCDTPITSLYKTVFDHFDIAMAVTKPISQSGIGTTIVFKLLKKDDLPKFLLYFGHLIKK